MVATGQMGRGGVVLVWTLEECPGAGTSSLAALTGVPSCLGLVCPGTDTGRAAAQSETSSLLGSGLPDLEHVNSKGTRFLYPASSRTYADFLFLFFLVFLHVPFVKPFQVPRTLQPFRRKRIMLCYFWVVLSG